MNLKNFDTFFADLHDGQIKPYKWQRDLATPEECGNRLIRIPTGFGKTLGVFTSWAWHRVDQQDDAWPRRLVWCLPMRTLVEQTTREICKSLDKIGLLWNGKDSHDGKVGVHTLMGGTAQDRYYLYPEADSVLIGTQDMLLSRSLNRGYASPRARWPVEFGLLNQDALWVMDEVQLMDVGLATSIQLQAFRRSDQQEKKMRLPCFTWWMSATLQPDWFTKSPDAKNLVGDLHKNTFQIAPKDRDGHLWTDVSKQLTVQRFTKIKELANDVSKYHVDAGHGRDGPTLVVLNTVARATEMYYALRSNHALKESGTDIRLIHSRFRPADRKSWLEFLSRDMKGKNRVIVSTQVIEAGVDISVPLLISDLAPWPSLVQRLGRCARRGGCGRVVIADFGYTDDKKSAPYTINDLDSTLEACDLLNDVSPLHLEQLEDEHTSLLPRLYRYEPSNLLLRNELDELFDTAADLSGADIDISRFIRSGDERDVHVFWADAHTPDIKPNHNEICNVPFLKAQDWLCKPNQNYLKPGVQAYVWSWLDRGWYPATRKNIYPGQTILVDSEVGGYDDETGWNPESKNPVKLVQTDIVKNSTNRDCWKPREDHYELSTRITKTFVTEDHADAAEEDDAGSISDWQTIAVHCLEVSKEIGNIASLLKMSHTESNVLRMAGRWHDIGKSHEAFQNSLKASDRPKRNDIAKGPDRAWPCSTNSLYYVSRTDHRRGFRHELAGAMALFSILRRHSPDHDALLGPWGEWLDTLATDGYGELDQNVDAPTIPEQEVIALNAMDFDLLAYLVCSHHGKVRMTWHASPLDYRTDNPRPSIRGIREGDKLPSLYIPTTNDTFCLVPGMPLTLSPSEMGLHPHTGRSWTERVLNLVSQKGPFTLAWLEAIIRAADRRASSKAVADKLLVEGMGQNTDTGGT
ncbi:MAG: CRISPR-associated helicase Cas3' [Cenarchaeum sp. SB0666_bin_15]|nr:CRISPR-associated helicase Cas3' [Cenarchaeum sp. SB0666_bin_15]